MNVWTKGPPSPAPADDVVETAGAVAEQIFALGAHSDAAAEFPARGIEALRAAGLLLAPFGPDQGGAGLALPHHAGDLFDVLRRIGGGDLSVGRLYEGHVNAVSLVYRHGRAEQVAALADAVRAGALSAVWNAEGRDPMRFRPKAAGWVIEGRKILASGAGSITRPLVTGLIDDEPWMAIPALAERHAADLGGWTAQGMRSSATGTIDLTGQRLGAADLIGRAGDYKLQPVFSGGAWRFCAVQLGAAERLVDLFRGALVDRGRGDDPYQRARVAACLAAVETAALWIEKAARMVAAEDRPATDIVAYVNLTRMVTERAGLDVMEHVHRGVGLLSFIRPNPIERVSRDLATYLRQPAPDGAMADAAATVLATSAPTGRLWSEA